MHKGTIMGRRYWENGGEVLQAGSSGGEELQQCELNFVGGEGV